MARVMLSTLVCCVLTTAIAAQPPRSGTSAKDDRSALQKSMHDFKRDVGGRGVGGKLNEEGNRRGSGAMLGRPTLTGLQFRSGVLVPDGGETSLGGISGSAEGKNSFGAGPLQNRATGKESSRTTASVRVWIIIFGEEEERQTGYSGRKDK